MIVVDIVRLHYFLMFRYGSDSEKRMAQLTGRCNHPFSQKPGQYLPFVKLT